MKRKLQGLEIKDQGKRFKEQGYKYNFEF